MARRRLAIHELRHVLNYLFDGEMETAKPLLQCRNFPRYEHDIYYWLYRNQIKGKKLVAFFQNESGLDSGEGYLNAINTIIQKIEKDRFKILKASDLT